MTADVIPLRHRAATRLGPKEARRLAQAAIPRACTARELLAFLLRVCDPRLGFTRQFRQEFLADELGVDERTVRRATRTLERAGLLETAVGTGRTWSTLTLDGDHLRAISVAAGLRNPLVNAAVSPGESDPIEGGQLVRPEGVNRPPRAGKLSGPNVRARERDTPEQLDPPNPPTRRGATGDDACTTHGAGCRRRVCGRSDRQRADQERRDMAERSRAAVQAAYRSDSEAARAAAAPRSKEEIAAIRKSIRKGEKPKKGDGE